MMHTETSASQGVFATIRQEGQQLALPALLHTLKNHGFPYSSADANQLLSQGSIVIGDKTIPIKLQNLRTPLPEKTVDKICRAAERELERQAPRISLEETSSESIVIESIPETPTVASSTQPVPEFVEPNISISSEELSATSRITSTVASVPPQTKVTQYLPDSKEVPLIKRTVQGGEYGADKQGVVHFLGDEETLEARIRNRDKLVELRRQKQAQPEPTAIPTAETGVGDDDTALRIKFGRTLYKEMQTNNWDIQTFSDRLNEALEQLSLPEVKAAHVESWVFGEAYPQQNQYAAIEKTLFDRLDVPDAEKEALREQLRAAYETSVGAIDAQGAGNVRDQLTFGRTLTQLRQKAGLTNDQTFAALLNETPRIVRDAGIPKEGFTAEQVENLIFGEHPITPSAVSVLTRALHDTHGKLHEIYQELNAQNPVKYSQPSEIQR